jgi:predicted ATPase/class 3 adenylate cyclase
MPERVLPTGTVTFLFSDMERSTQLVQELGQEAFTELLEQHHRILRRACSVHGGIERGTEGDSFFVIFTDAAAAVEAAVQAQQELAAASWPADSRVRVRMGIHTGSGVLGGDDYVGVDVNRAARIAAAAHGAQVLISEATRTLVADRLPDGVRAQTLGSYRLKDLPGAEILAQLEIRGLPASFPPLRALDVRRAHLPPESTSFIGRAKELDQIGRFTSAHRLVTLTGPGGSGKSRLALRAAADVAQRFADGAFFVGLASITDARLLPAAITSAIGLPDESNATPRTTLLAWIRDRELLLLLDNLEQLDDADQIVDELLASAPGLRVLGTSRSRLHVAGEQEFPVPPFEIPARDGDASTLEASEAVRLFLDRARLVRPDLSATENELRIVVDICGRLDGLPLAIELAAARVRLLPLAAIRDRLLRRLDALVGGPSTVPRRQQSLREAIAWSHDLLDEEAKVLFRRLAVFVGGWTIEAAEEVCGGRPLSDVERGLEGLVDQSLIQVTLNDTEPRFSMLETIAEYAREQLEASGESAELVGNHRRVFRALAEATLEHADGPDRDTWFERAEADLDNLRAAITRGSGDDPREALAIAAALRAFWLQRNHSAEGLRTLVALSDRGDPMDSPEFAAATAAAAAIADWLGDYATARRMGELSVAAYRHTDNQWALAEALGSFAFGMIEVEPARALVLNQESFDIYRDLGDVRGEGQALLGRATALFALGRLPETREALERSLELLRRAEDHYFALFSGIFLARIKLLMGDPVGGMRGYRAVLETSQALDLRLGVAAGLDYIAEVAIWAGDVPQAVRLGATAARLKEELGGGVPPRMGGALDPLEVGRERLAPEEFDRQTAAGRAMDIDSAIAEALALEPPAAATDDR